MVIFQEKSWGMGYSNAWGLTLTFGCDTPLYELAADTSAVVGAMR